MKVKLTTILLAIILIFSQMLLLSKEVSAAQPTVRLSDVKGDVIVRLGGGVREFPAVEGMELVQGDWLRTGKTGTAKLSYEDGTEATLGAGSYLNIQQLTTSDSEGVSALRQARITAWEDGHQSSVQLWSGSVWSKVKSLVNIDDKYEVETPTAVLGVRGTLYLVSVDQDNGSTQSHVIDGAVGVSQNNEGTQAAPIQVVTMGQTLRLVSSTEPLPANQVINQQELIKNTQPEILVKLINDLVQRTQELASATKDAQQTFGQTGNLEDITSAIGNSFKLSALASFSKEFMDNILGSDKLDAVKQVLQETNQTIEQVQQTVDTVKTETEQIRSEVVETAKSAGVSQEKIDSIEQEASGAPLTPAPESKPAPETTPTPTPTTPTPTPAGGGQNSSDHSSDPAPLLGTVVPIVADTPITFAGGVKIDLGGLSIPAGATVKADEVNLSETELPTGASIAGKVLDFTLDGMTINSPVAITLPLSSNADPSKVGVFYKNGSIWEYQDSTIINRNVVATVNHFSIYGVLETTGTVNQIGQSASLDGTQLKLKFDKPLNNQSIPAVTDFSVINNSMSIAVTKITINGDTLILDLAQAIIKNDQVTISYTVGAKHIRDLNGNSAQGFNITIKKVDLKSIAITTPATKLTYKVGETLDISGLVITGTNMDDSTQIEPVTAADVTGFDSTAPAASQTLTITIRGKTTSFTIRITKAELKSIAITTPATKLTYKVGETLDLSGLIITGTNMDDSTQIEPVTAADVKGFDSTAPVESQTLTITIRGKTTNYTIKVLAPDKVKPVITLLGSQVVNLANGASYADAGATAMDNLDGIITNQIVTTITNSLNTGSSLDTSVAGTYTYHYNVSDAAGNKADEVTRTVVVAAVPVVPPIIITTPTTAGSLSVLIIIEDIPQPVLTYTLGENYSNGQVVFSLPEGITAALGDDIRINGDESYGLGPDNIINPHQVKISNITASCGATVVLTLDRAISAGIWEFSVKGDSDGDGPLKLMSTGVGTELVNEICIPYLITESTIENMDEDPSVSLTLLNGTFTSGSESPSNWTINVGQTGLEEGNYTITKDSNFDYKVTITFAGTAAAGTITLKAETAALDSIYNVASNTMSIVVPSGTPPSSGTIAYVLSGNTNETVKMGGITGLSSTPTGVDLIPTGTSEVYQASSVVYNSVYQTIVFTPPAELDSGAYDVVLTSDGTALVTIPGGLVVLPGTHTGSFDGSSIVGYETLINNESLLLVKANSVPEATDKVKFANPSDVLNVLQLSSNPSFFTVLNSNLYLIWLNSSNQIIDAYEVYSPQEADSVYDLSAIDLNTHNNETDLQVVFSDAGNDFKGSEYRIMIVPSAVAVNFELIDANAVIQANYTVVDSSEASEEIYTKALPSGAKDIYGAAVVMDIAYKVFVLTVANCDPATVNALAEAPEEIILANYGLVQGTEIDSTKIIGLNPNTEYQYVIDGSYEFTGNWNDSSPVIISSDSDGVIDNIHNVYPVNGFEKYIHVRLTSSSPVQNLKVTYSVIHPS